jgi:hypothetical protein
MFRRWCQLRCWIRHATPTKYPSYYQVKICDEWNDFATFAEYIDSHWNIKKLSSDDIFDRIDNTQPYEPGNVRFTSKKGNARSRKTTHYLTYNGRTQSIADWAEETGRDFSCVLSRVYAGWTAEDIITKD